MFFDEVNDAKYKEVFESVYALLSSSIEENPEKSKLNLERQLEDLYFQEGNDWLGRSEHQAITISATIAACEILLLELK
ncbi:hypothetical protein QE109_14180 [Fusibacter bizertensis]|uniref:Uncharacterized protein n=1 Tax=Fusibacter bizertensis TaxID=1488331 RepID=A0ABT6NG00_9FIRM|nr:hypothetical protein [Fusibacter bizertensis]MDH8679302.1 hypothetical protein [Fusibacter bizertensis]